MEREFVQPDGERLIIQKSGRETDGELLEMKVTYNPNSALPPQHYHPYQDEQFEVLRGTFRVILDDQETVYRAGEKFTVPANTPHAMQNIDDEQGQLLWQVRPARKTEDLLTTLWGLADDGKTDASGMPGLLQVAVISRAYRDEIRLAKPPYIVQRILFSLLAPIGRLQGYRARYKKYSGEHRSDE